MCYCVSKVHKVFSNGSTANIKNSKTKIKYQKLNCL